MKHKPQAPTVPTRQPRISIRPLLSFRPTRSGLPPINSMQPTMASLNPGGRDGAEPAGIATPTPGVTGLLMRHRRHAALSALALSVAVGSLAAARAHVRPGVKVHRGAATAVLKEVNGGQHVRWQQDAIDVVVDKSLTDLAGPGVVGKVIDAWRASGADLPSISTTRGEKRRVGYDPMGHNENVMVYAPDGWAKANGALAVTVLTYDDATGRILDADVLLNGGDRAFAVLESDDGKGTSAALELGTTAQVNANGSSGKKGKFDVQSVLTHELGHFFGLGEDYEDTSTTMYAKTSAGETHKRILTDTDSGIITALYTGSTEAPGADGPVKAGCGGAHFARGRATLPTGTWIGWASALLGLGLLAGSRRQRLEPRMIRVSEDPIELQRRAAARARARRAGGFIMVLGVAALAAPSELSAAPPPAQGDADVEVIASAPRWVDGVLETEVTLKLTACRVANCPQGDQHVTVAGGSLDHVTQVVGPYAVPAVGEHASIQLRDGSGLMRRLGRTYVTTP